MLKIISKENQSVLFKKEEIKYSIFLNNMFFNKNFYSNDSDSEEEEEEKEESIELKNISILSLVKIKGIIKYVIKNKLEKGDSYLNGIIKISLCFSIKDFFELLDAANYLHIDFIIKLMVDYLKEEIEDDSIFETMTKFDLNKKDFSENENNTLNLLNAIILT